MLVGKILRNRYSITSRLGEGGFGVTYFAEDKDLPNSPKCVVKHLKVTGVKSTLLPTARRLFESEAEALYKLGSSHDQIPRLFAHFEEQGEFYLVQEFIDGCNLLEEFNFKGPLIESETTKLLYEILDVLAFVHQAKIIHRDIKPENIMRRWADGKIVLIDFGAVKEISTLLINSRGQTGVTVCIGTPGYMPAEQSSGKPKLSSDVYAVGMIGIQALTGKDPRIFNFDDPQTGEIIWRNLVRGRISDQLANVLTRMVHYHFNQRFSSADEALKAIKSLLPPVPTSTAQPQIAPSANLFATSPPPTPFVVKTQTVVKTQNLLSAAPPPPTPKTKIGKKIATSLSRRPIEKLRGLAEVSLASGLLIGLLWFIGGGGATALVDSLNNIFPSSKVLEVYGKGAVYLMFYGMIPYLSELLVLICFLGLPIFIIGAIAGMPNAGEPIIISTMCIVFTGTVCKFRPYCRLL